MKSNVKVCPKCHKSELRVGYLKQLLIGIRCERCGIQVDKRIPDQWPSCRPKDFGETDPLAWLEQFVLDQVTDCWNALPRQRKFDRLAELEQGRGEC